MERVPQNESGWEALKAFWKRTLTERSLTLDIDEEGLSVQKKQKIGPKGLIEDCYIPGGDVHAFYVGKIPLRGPWLALKDISGWEEQNPTYSKPYLQAALSYAQTFLQDGPVRFVIGVELQTFCNGRDSMQGHLSAQEERAFLLRVAQEHHVPLEDVLISTFREDHPELFLALDAAADPISGRVQLDQVFLSEMPILSASSNALELATVLYKAAQKSSKLRKAFQSLIPEELKKQRDADENTFCSMDAYGLFEVAIRLVDILRGRYIHGGVDRQGALGQVIIQLIRGREGIFSSILALDPLFTLLQAQSFQALNIDRNKNEFERERIVHRARSRIHGIYGLGASIAVAVASSYGIWSYHQKAEQEGYFDQAVLRVGSHIQCPEIPNFDLTEQARSIESQFASDLSDRYKTSIPFGDLEPFLMEELFSHPKVCLIMNSDQDRLDFLDDFVRHHPFVFCFEGNPNPAAWCLSQ